MEPMAGNIQCHAELEEKHVLWIEEAQGSQQTHCCTAIS